MKEQMSDTDLLDALQSTTKGFGNGWVLRESSNGRGMRLHETEGLEGFPTVREAIIDYLLNVKK